jgi:hypothetical protein
MAERDRIAEGLIGVLRILAEHECRPSGSLRGDARR